MENLCVLCGDPSGDKLFCPECDAPEGVERLPDERYMILWREGMFERGASS